MIRFRTIAGTTWVSGPSSATSLLSTMPVSVSPIELHTYAGAYHDFDYPGIRLHEEPGYRTTSGVVPIVGTDPAAREDALARVPAFLGRYLLD